MAHALAAVVFSTVSLFGIYTTYSGSGARQGSTSIAAAAPRTASAPKAPPLLEVHIANNGHAHLRGAQIRAVHRGSIDVLTKWGLLDFVWSIDTSPRTRYVGLDGESLDRKDVRVGQFASITGTIGGSSRVPVIHAEYVRVTR